jgi:O-antigen ligase
VLWAAALVVPLALLPLLARPGLGLALAAVALAAVAANRSVAYPVALAGAPGVLVGLIGSDPFPRGALVIFVFVWMLFAIVATLIRDEGALSSSIWFTGPVGVTCALAVLMVARLQSGSTAYGLSFSYPSFKFQLFVTGNLILVVAGILIGRSEHDFDLLILLTLAISALSALVLIKQLLSGHAVAPVGGRYSISPLENPIFLGRRSAEGIIIALFVLLTGKAVWMRMAGLAAVPFLTVALLASGSRGPVLALIVGTVVLLAFLLRDPVHRRRLVGVAVGAVAAGVLAPQLVPGGNIGRSLSFLVGSTGGLSSTGRFHLWSEAWNSFLAHPLFGLGTGGFSRFEPVYLYPHNLFLEAMAEYGIIGLVLVVAFVGYGLSRMRAAWRLGSSDTRLRTALVVALFSSAFVNTLLSDSLELATAVWLAVGLSTGLALAASKRASESTVGEGVLETAPA